jgi:UDP-3-O-[3-hydroxymyristoyl] glucosamine N-acyltransferase
MPHSPISHTLAELAERFELTLSGDGVQRINGVGTLEDSDSTTITFLANRAYRNLLPNTQAGAVILSETDAPACPVNHLIAADPYLAYARIAALFDHRTVAGASVHEAAQVHPDAVLGDGVAIGPCAVIGAGAVIGQGSVIGPGSVVSENARLGANCRLYANATVCEDAVLGDRVIVHPGAVIGADGFGLARGPQGWEKVPQLGSVILGNDCEIGANSCIDRGAIGDTVLEEDVRLDNHVQIGHNCHIGAHTAMAAYTGISGSTRIGRNCMFAGRSGAHGHITIADGVTVSAMSMVQKDIGEPGTVWAAGIPARPIREWHRALGHLRKLGKQHTRTG